MNFLSKQKKGTFSIQNRPCQKTSSEVKKCLFKNVNMFLLLYINREIINHKIWANKDNNDHLVQLCN